MGVLEGSRLPTPPPSHGSRPREVGPPVNPSTTGRVSTVRTSRPLVSRTTTHDVTGGPESSFRLVMDGETEVVVIEVIRLPPLIYSLVVT